MFYHGKEEQTLILSRRPC